MKKTVGLLLCFFMLLTSTNSGAYAAHSIPSKSMVADTSYEINKVIQYAEGKLNTSFANGYCLRFVRYCFKDCYGIDSSTCCAYKYGNEFIDDTSRDNIPIGADVFFGGSKYICSTCKNKCGHIGIYVGDGNIIHAWDGKIQKMSIDYIISRGYPYRGWGWHADMTFTSAPPPTPEIPKSGVSYVIKNARSSKYLNVYRSGSSNGTNVNIYSKDGTKGQTFKLKKTSSGWYTFAPACATSSRLNVYGTSAKNGSNITIYSNSNHSTQGWYLEKVSNGYIIRSADNTNCVLTAEGTGNSSNVKLATYSRGNKYQIWSFYN